MAVHSSLQELLQRKGKQLLPVFLPQRLFLFPEAADVLVQHRAAPVIQTVVIGKVKQDLSGKRCPLLLRHAVDHILAEARQADVGTDPLQVPEMRRLRPLIPPDQAPADRCQQFRGGFLVIELRQKAAVKIRVVSEFSRALSVDRSRCLPRKSPGQAVAEHCQLLLAEAADQVGILLVKLREGRVKIRTAVSVQVLFMQEQLQGRRIPLQKLRTEEEVTRQKGVHLRLLQVLPEKKHRTLPLFLPLRQEGPHRFVKQVLIDAVLAVLPHRVSHGFEKFPAAVRLSGEHGGFRLKKQELRVLFRSLSRRFQFPDHLTRKRLVAPSCQLILRPQGYIFRVVFFSCCLLFPRRSVGGLPLAPHRDRDRKL